MNNIIDLLSPDKSELLPSQLKIFESSDYPLGVFDPLVISFFNELSQTILKHENLGKIPATAALGFWLRKSHINQIINENRHLTENEKVQTGPSGIVFHICPSNVDTMFLYSLAISLLCGNKNILRISQRISDPTLDVLFLLISTVLAEDDFKILTNYIAIVSYGHNDDVNNYFSSVSDVRIIWGGDATIQTFKRFKTGARTKDIAFADRISCSIFKADTFLSASETTKAETARKFFNDSYTFDQLGCSSPQQVFVLGNEDAKKAFENEFYNLVLGFSERNYNNDIASIASLKLTQLAEDAVSIGASESAMHSNNFLYFVNLNPGNETIYHSCGAGYFYVQRLDKLDEIVHLVNSKLQSLSYFGLTNAEINHLSKITKGKGIDRIVPVGKALDFEYIWDGYNLFDELTKKQWVV